MRCQPKVPVSERVARPVTLSASNAGERFGGARTEGGDVGSAPDDAGPASPFAEAIEGFVNLGGWVLHELGTHARSVGQRIDDGYTPDALARDVARSGALVAAAGVRTLNEVVDAAVILACARSANIATATFPMPERLVGVPCKLRAVGPLRSRFDPPDLIPRARVSVRAPDITAGETAFTVRVDATRRPGLNYWGRVLVTPAQLDDDAELVDIRVGVR